MPGDVIPWSHLRARRLRKPPVHSAGLQVSDPCSDGSYPMGSCPGLEVMPPTQRAYEHSLSSPLAGTRCARVSRST